MRPVSLLARSIMHLSHLTHPPTHLTPRRCSLVALRLPIGRPRTSVMIESRDISASESLRRERRCAKTSERDRHWSRVRGKTTGRPFSPILLSRRCFAGEDADVCKPHGERNAFCPPWDHDNAKIHATACGCCACPVDNAL